MKTIIIIALVIIIFAAMTIFNYLIQYGIHSNVLIAIAFSFALQMFMNGVAIVMVYWLLGCINRV